MEKAEPGQWDSVPVDPGSVVFWSVGQAIDRVNTPTEINNSSREPFRTNLIFKVGGEEEGEGGGR